MFSQRRLRLLLITVVAVLFLTFYYSGDASKVQNQTFYRTTLSAMKAQEAARQAQAQAESAPMHRPADSVDEEVKKPAVPLAQGGTGTGEDMEEISIAGRTKIQVSKNRGSDANEDTSAESEEQKAAAAAKEELDTILKQAPVIIFSKSYCPFSKKAKSILLDKYDITPRPFVVELDNHRIGKDLQNLLWETTGRNTVPNVMVNGKSIGGGDDIDAMDYSDELASKLQTLGGNWLREVKRGPRGKLVKDLSHLAVTFGRPEKNVISIELHHGIRKGVATLRTVRTIINNLIIGVTRGFLYKMRYVYAHFPINVNIEKNPETGVAELEIRNFLGEKYVRRVTAQPGVEIITSPNVKDELQLSGNSLEGVSQSAADIQQICRVRNKDIRKFLDGLYVSERGNIIEA
ncbi:hypothetical protein N7474_008120 [Penicillium riverlandense]|uniref:uncharacterized protein n=1 Tax=Penicillium riverlandense TaxID=1903569 RepID=UPI0025481BBE|nr:uncharacterized protein N7474_008120 [Penicillium riverlandense]KAJ5811819.1 hypothetical protein N7474_008120 [Penicillium riverlandense]